MEDNLEHFADRLIAGMSDAIVYADVEGVIRRWNGGATRIFGFTDTEALGQSLDIIIPESLRARHWHGYRTTIQTGQSRYGEGQLLSVPAVRKDGSRISVEFTIVPFTNSRGQNDRDRGDYARRNGRGSKRCVPYARNSRPGQCWQRTRNLSKTPRTAEPVVLPWTARAVVAATGADNLKRSGMPASKPH